MTPQTEALGSSPRLTEAQLKPPRYIPNFGEQARSFFEALALRFSRKKVLVAGPYAGEFGHEIMDFQSYVRWLKPKYKEVHVLTFPGREALYRGCHVHTHRHDLRTAGYLYGKITHSEIKKEAAEFARAQQIRNCDFFSTAHLSSRWHRRLLFGQAHEMFKPLRPMPPSPRILFHFRNIKKEGPDLTRNMRPDLAEEVCRMCRSQGLEIACIGHPQYALCPEGCQDWRTEDLEETLTYINACPLVAGELSGPLHLAAYCGKPIVTWVPEKSRLTNAYRRNPFNVPVFVVRDNTKDPAPEEILGKVLEAKARVGGAAAI